MKNWKELTPKTMLCKEGSCCPAVFETEEGNYVLIGKKIDQAGLQSRIGEGEIAVEIPRELLADVK